MFIQLGRVEPMHYVISDSEGNTLDTFRDERDAELALLAMVAAQPSDANELLLLAHADDGTPVGAARLAQDIPTIARLLIGLVIYEQTTATVEPETVRITTTHRRTGAAAFSRGRETVDA